MEKNTVYFTFPLAILRWAFTDISKVCGNAMDYAFYVKYAEVEDIKEAERFLQITFGDKEATLKDGKTLFDKYGQNCTMVSVNKDIVFEFYKNPKTEFEIATFLAFCGLRSILGVKAYTKTNNEHLMARMAGYGTYREFEEAGVDSDIEYFVSLATPQKIRYQLTEKIIRQELCLNWGLKYYSSRNRGFYFSFNIDLVDLILVAEKQRKSNRLKEQKAKEVEAMKTAKNRLLKYG